MADARAPLLTGWGPFVGGGACYTFGVAGPLRFDPEFGTTITADRGQPVPVMWPPGYTARWVGSEVAVQDGSGRTVAMTGASYDIEGGYWSEDITPTASNHYAFSGPRVFLACGSVSPRP